MSETFGAEALTIAGESDRETVLSLVPGGDVFSGIDYIHSTFGHLVTGSNVIGFLYKVKDEVVAFASTVLVDEGQTLVVKGARVKTGYQGQGVYSRFNRAVENYYTSKPQLYPNLHTLAMTTNLVNWQGNGQRILRSGYRAILETHNTILIIPVSALEKLQEEDPVLDSLTQEDLVQLMEDPQQWRSLFPEERLMLNWKPFRVLSSNVPLLFQDCYCPVFYGTPHLSPDSEGKYKMFSIGSYYPCLRGIYFSMDLYGQGDTIEIRDHVMKHLHRLRRLQPAGGDIVLGIIFSKRLDDIADEIKTLIKGRDRDHSLLLANSTILLEKNLSH